MFFPGKFGLCPPGDFYFFSRSYTAGCRKYRISRPSASACLIKVELISNNVYTLDEAGKFLAWHSYKKDATGWELDGLINNEVLLAKR